MSSRRAFLIALNLLFAALLARSLADPIESPEAITQRDDLRTATIDDSLAPDPARNEPSRALFRSRPAEVAAPAAALPPFAPPFELAGVVWGDDGRVAVVRLKETGEHRRLRLSEEWNGWRLIALNVREASFEAGDHRETLTLAARTGSARAAR
jgi:hypothetical protein